MLLAADTLYFEAEEIALSEVRATISGGYGILPTRKDVFGDEATTASASPFGHFASRHPPFLIMYGDATERHELSKVFHDALKKAGGQAEAREGEGGNTRSFSPRSGTATSEAALAFITRASTGSK